MHSDIDRRSLLVGTAVIGVTTAIPARAEQMSMGAVRRVRAGVLNIGYHELVPQAAPLCCCCTG
jgi:hypothetical protein